MNDKLIIERYKTAKRDAKLAEPPHLFTSEEIADLKAMALAVLAASENKTPRSIRPLNDKPKSEARQEFEDKLEGILDRWKDAPHTPTLHTTYPGKPCLAASVTEATDSDVPLHELLKQTKLLMLKVERRR